jgi:hypothetical protein
VRANRLINRPVLCRSIPLIPLSRATENPRDSILGLRISARSGRRFSLPWRSVAQTGWRCVGNLTNSRSKLRLVGVARRLQQVGFHPDQ